jgi:hypothetical protein
MDALCLANSRFVGVRACEVMKAERPSAKRSADANVRLVTWMAPRHRECTTGASTADNPGNCGARSAPSVAAMEAADSAEVEDVGCRARTPLDHASAWRVLADREVRAVQIVIADERVEQALQVAPH